MFDRTVKLGFYAGRLVTFDLFTAMAGLCDSNGDSYERGLSVCEKGVETGV